ncbi:DUF58 domain-containing protein [Natrarchaeobius chitinivorans]|uniref:DUF58 domain-containing protein n=1 Tax=Natrarchaeobius chitinivorans TaxID=1679083 RepID=A0A3N6M4R6_NATCH|nr:DUF58 domain-containing protein [Natrarchaeobius chitinivorans]RQG90980.1 DUF58 domain-containing protein [Natrarchaeobius chitinivorans]
MQPNSRFLAVWVLSVVLVGFGIVLESPLYLAGAVAVWGWIVARQIAFTIELLGVVDGLSVTQELEQTTFRAGDSVSVTLEATLEEPSSLRLSLSGGVPTPASLGDDRAATPLALTLESGMTTATVTRPVAWPVSGRHEFDEPTVTATDGYVQETITAGDPPTVTVAPRDDDRIHVGAAGNRIGSAYGEHESGRLDAGEVPAELREYVPGDTADRIDWKVTARLGTPHVREFETDTDRRTVLVVDHRGTLADGSLGETKFDYLRDVALSFAETAFQRGNPIELVSVDDDGITSHVGRTTAGGEYRTIRRRLFDLEPSATGTLECGRRLTGDEARRRLGDITGGGTDEGPFVATLRPFYEERASGTDRIGVDSLADGVRAALGAQQHRQRTVVFTDCARPDELRRTVSIARSSGTDVLVFLAPAVLYGGDTDDRERAFDQYHDFERFRRDLSRMENVSALEVGPVDRFSTLLTGEHDGRGRSRGGLS